MPKSFDWGPIQLFDTQRVKQICNESSKTANPLYIKLSPPSPDSFSAKAISNKIILTCQALRFTDSKKKVQIPQCGILIAEYVGNWQREPNTGAHRKNSNCRFR
jgi:hypothetical protein